MIKGFSIRRIVYFIGFSLVCATAAEATPAYARQMDMECMSCHYQNIPKLNAFGREFKISGFTMTSGKKEIKSNQNGGLALPEHLGFGFVLKARLHDTKKGDPTVADDHTTFSEIFDESALLFGGKISDNIGGSFELANGTNDIATTETDINGTTVITSVENEGSGAGISGKLTFTKAFSFGRLGVTAFNTDSLGVFSGTEIYSTGLYRPIRQFENRKKANILQRNGIGDGSASGVQAYYYGHGLYATFGQYVPGYGQSIDVSSEGYKDFARVAYEFSLADFTIAAGGFYIGGDIIGVTQNANDVVWTSAADSFDRKANGFDMQIEGAVNGMPLMITGAALLNNKYSPSGNKASNKAEKTGFSFDAQLNPASDFGLKLAYLSHSDDVNEVNDESIISAGAEYNVAQNVRLCIEYSNIDYPNNSAKNTDSDLLFMAMVAF